MNIEKYIALERLHLQQERKRLSVNESQAIVQPEIVTTSTTCNTPSSLLNGSPEKTCPAAHLLETGAYSPKPCRMQSSNILECNDPCYIAINSASLAKCQNGMISATGIATASNNSDDYDKNEAKKQANEEMSCTYMFYTKGTPTTNEDVNAAPLRPEPVDFHLDLSSITCSDNHENANYNYNDSALEKCVKDLTNQSTARSETLQTNEMSIISSHKAASDSATARSIEGDDMEQWVTDKFYSYFPGYNNENEKRQNYLRERQRENQQNFLKHQMLHPPVSKHAVQKKSFDEQNFDNDNSARSCNSTASNNTTSSTIDKTDLEIIVNNPNYKAPKFHNTEKPRPGTTRQKLLQDLGHVQLSNIVTGNGIMERNLRSAELETKRKKDYQRDLMQQIEEKRRAIQLIKEKELKQEEALTRRLETQLKTMQLEEQLEKERLREEKIRIDSEHNRLMREQILIKLENDAKLLNTKQQKHYNREKQFSIDLSAATSHENNVNAANSGGGGGVGVTVANLPSSSQTNANTNVNANTNSNANANANNDNNKVYKYFSNSARHEYRRGQPMPEEVEFDIELQNVPKIERECFHLCEKICPLCDEPLKSYESCCLRCQKNLALKMKAKRSKKTKPRSNVMEGVIEFNVSDKMPQENQTVNKQTRSDDDNTEAEAEEKELDECDDEACRTSYALVCHKCERLYAMCTNCLAKSDVCRACHRQRNVCMNCRRTLCTFCLEEIACGKDTERMHINELEYGKKQKPEAFHVLEVNYAAQKDSDAAAVMAPVSSSTDTTPPTQTSTPLTSTSTSSPPNNNKTALYTKIHNKLDNTMCDRLDDHKDVPYSINNTYKSLPKPVFFDTLPTVALRPTAYDLDVAAADEAHGIERVKRETDKRLERYLKNYSDLAQRQRSKSDSRNRSTQTSSESSARRDIVMHESEHNLSMPLLREMPKMTRNESTNMLAQAALNNQRKFDNLNRRWEVPAVQKFHITHTKPKVLTQVGAIRKQLQAESLQDDAIF